MMSRLSIFNFDTLQAPVKSLLLNPVVVFTIAILLTIELGLRFIIPSNHVPTGSWYNAELRDQVDQLKSMSHVDLMITGSSIAAVNLRPSEIDSVYQKNNIALKSFNAGIRGCNYTCINIGFQKLFLSQKEPRYVLIVVTPTDLNESNKFVINRSNNFIKSFSTKIYVKTIVNTLSHSWLFGFRSEIREYFKSREWIYEESKITKQGHIQLGDKREGENRSLRKNIITVDPSGPISNSLYELTTSILSQNIKVIVLPGLMNSNAHSVINESTWNNFSIVLDNLANNKDVTILNANHLIPSDENFIDPVHLSNKSSVNYSQTVAEFLFEQDLFK